MMLEQDGFAMIGNFDGRFLIEHHFETLKAAKLADLLNVIESLLTQYRSDSFDEITAACDETAADRYWQAFWQVVQPALKDGRA